ncbi:Rpn family recombination-promoting nuclease/putative transposase [Sporosarcina thermotolerans]|uniref:Rpn family recombination-promoting nuclease/putative transposase n=1 Tax=Sporosarcina thermotolerans TaxID=633404 RepID=UPI0036D3FC26
MVALVKEESAGYDLELLELRNDFVFKSFFTDERNNGLLLHFVNSILGGSIQSLQVIDPTNKQEHNDDKYSVLDLRATTDRGERINIEVQLQRHPAFNERVLYYWAKTYTAQFKSSDPYTKLKKVIQIIITDFELLPSSGIHSTFLLIEPSSGVIFSNHLEIHALQMGKQGEKPVTDMDDLEKWLLFFKGDQKAKEEVGMESSTFKEAFEEIRRLSMDPETVDLAISREIALRDHLTRLEEAEIRGKNQGKEQTIKEFVLKMYDESLPLDLICKLADLSKEEVHLIINGKANN